MSNVKPLKRKVPGAVSASSEGLAVAAIEAAIASWQDIAVARQCEMASAVHTAQRILAVAEAGKRGSGGAPLYVVDVWTCARLNAALWAHPPSFFKLAERRHSNVISLLRAILIRLGLHEDAGPRRNRLSAPWQALYDALPTDDRRRGLVLFFRFCTLQRIDPATIDPRAIDRFEDWCREAILCKDPLGMSRRAAGNWSFVREKIAGWPQVELTRVGARNWYAIPWEAFPAGLQADAERFLDRLRSGPGSIFAVESIFAGNPKERSRNTPCRAMRPKTIERRRDDIKLAMTALVASGIPMEELTTLRALFEPIDRVRIILSFHRERKRRKLEGTGETITDEDDLRSSHLGLMADTLRQIATFYLDLPATDVTFIKRGAAEVRLPRQHGMTEKNAARLRGLGEPRVYAKMLHLPGYWMGLAADPREKPHDAALWAMYAVAIEILLICPLRRGNLVRLTLDRQLRRPSPRALITDLLVPAAEVKNREAVIWRVEPHTARVIETYIMQYRPHLVEPGNRYLFPGAKEGTHRNEAEFGAELTRRVEWDLGVEFHPHLVRHFAAWRWLRQNPGEYETAARMLGHRSTGMLRDVYGGLEFDSAARHSNDILTGERDHTRALAAAAFKVPAHTLNSPRPGKGDRHAR